VVDPKQLYRSDFFPGLGWMLRNDLWQEIKWAFSLLLGLSKCALLKPFSCYVSYASKFSNV
jgi:hypothetical protein